MTDSADSDDVFSRAREQMVRQQLAGRGIRDPGVLRAMSETPRHLFVPPSLENRAYTDQALPIGYSATISQPYVVALMTESLRVSKRDRVLEIGTGSGYQAAVLAGLVRQVYTIEIVPELARAARERLRRLGYSNVAVREGDGYLGWPEEAPFDAIVITAAPDEIPPALLGQLKNGGRMVAPVGPSFEQDLVLVTKSASGAISRSTIAGVAFVPMKRSPR